MKRAKNRGKKPKVSEMILKMAEGFLDMAEDTEHMENLLRMACTAWNIACFEAPRRHDLIRKYVETFREANNASEATGKDLEEDMRRLIEKKDQLYPHIKIRIVDSQVELRDGREHVIVASTPLV